MPRTAVFCRSRRNLGVTCPCLQPEFTGEVFRTLYTLFKYVSSALVKDMDAVRR